MAEEYQSVIVLGDTICEFARPSNAIRWVERDGQKVLQQAWVAQHQDVHGYVTFTQEQWRDVPTERE
jgi:hypothetical protein